MEIKTCDQLVQTGTSLNFKEIRRNDMHDRGRMICASRNSEKNDMRDDMAPQNDMRDDMRSGSILF